MFTCHNCAVCLGNGCVGELPGMGGVRQNENFKLNCLAWESVYSQEDSSKIKHLSKEKITTLLRVAPITGAQQNIGFQKEEDFYYTFFKSVYESGVNLSIGDGAPDLKLMYGIKAIQRLQREKDKYLRAAVFLKPYPDENLINRIAWSIPIASHIGIDIDAYNIVTMRNQVNLEKKTASQIQKIMKGLQVPFVLKGVFTKEDLELVKESKPDIVYISNHGGRVETRKGSTAIALKELVPIVKNYCKEVWVDGGIRCKRDVELAYHYGASQVLVARPFIKDFCYKQKVILDSFIL